MEIRHLRIKPETISFTKKTRKWCQLPYPDHPNGCPNYGKNPSCPPDAEYMDSILSKYSHFYLIYAIFNLDGQKRRMLSRHPDWTDRQATCLLYWQNSVKKALQERLREIQEINPEKRLYVLSSGSGFKQGAFNQEKIYSLEAGGIDVFRTLKKNGISFELKPEKKVKLVTLACSNGKLRL